jgi:hypothetical protein
MNVLVELKMLVKFAPLLESLTGALFWLRQNTEDKEELFLLERRVPLKMLNSLVAQLVRAHDC